MKNYFGWVGNILFIDLSREKTWVESIDPHLSWIGGRGINQWLLFNLVGKNVHPLDPENVLVLGAGPMNGTLVPGSGRLSIDFKNLITGGIGSANCGGRFSAEMKYAGYDHIVIQGRAARPTYLYIEDQQVHFRDASDLWGRDTWATDRRIQEKEKDPLVSTLTIGPAGEKLVRFACIIGDRGRAAAYGGNGAIMGSKNLKAIAIRGKSSPVHVARPEGFMERLRNFRREVFEKSRAVRVHREGGTLGAYLLLGENRPHGVKNLREEFWSNASIQNVTRDKFDPFMTRRHSCFGCPVYCLAIYRVKDFLCEGIQANSLRAFGSNMDVTCAEDVLQAHGLCNLYGLDTDQTSASIAWAIECFEKEILNLKDTDGLILRFGDGTCVSQLIQKIAKREGVGDILAQGVEEASKIIGRGSEELAALVKKTSIMEQGMRSHRAWALGIVTSTRGTGHLRGSSGLEFQKIPPEVSQRILQVEDISDPTSYKNKAALVVWQERYKGIIDMVGLCALPSMWMDITLYSPDDIAGLLNDLTGKNYSGKELMHVGEKLQTLERAFNLLHAGLGRADDMPPKKFVEVPVHEGVFKGEKLDLEKWNQMLDEYYDLHGWDRESGWPMKKTLSALGLEEAAVKLAEAGISIP
ncbi:MAG: aldehyde ferredoxin oxidoreductase family protein [Deltaproteobacteria bacterium]|nr:aldehyde ferredoxin oxidoreductase family protein [Deltaproteobacteria bacterium]